MAITYGVEPLEPILSPITSSKNHGDQRLIISGETVNNIESNQCVGSDSPFQECNFDDLNQSNVFYDPLSPFERTTILKQPPIPDKMSMMGKIPAFVNPEIPYPPTDMYPLKGGCQQTRRIAASLRACCVSWLIFSILVLVLDIICFTIIYMISKTFPSCSVLVVNVGMSTFFLLIYFLVSTYIFASSHGEDMGTALDLPRKECVSKTVHSVIVVMFLGLTLWVMKNNPRPEDSVNKKPCPLAGWMAASAWVGLQLLILILRLVMIWLMPLNRVRYRAPLQIHQRMQAHIRNVVDRVSNQRREVGYPAMRHDIFAKEMERYKSYES